MIRSVIVVALLTLVYALVLGSFALWDLFIGAVLAASLRLVQLYRLPGHRPRPPITVGRLIALWPFLAVVAWDVLVGAWTVLRVTLRLMPMPRSGILAVPIGERTPIGVAVSALAIGLSPGTAMLDVDWDRKVMLIHVFDVSDPEETRARFQEHYARYQRPVFP